MIPLLSYRLLADENAVTILNESDLIELLAAIQGDSAYVPDATGGL